MRIILVDDSKETFVLVKAALNGNYDLHWAQNLAEAEKALREHTYDLILLDIMLPDGDGFGFCAKLQGGKEQDIPLIFVTGKTGTSNLVTGLALGADDYVVKPFDPLELRARIESKLIKKNRSKSSGSIIIQGDLKINLESQTAHLLTETAETKMELTPIEFKLLSYLARSPDHVFSRDQLITAVWGENVSVTDRTVDKHVSLLRQKLDFCSYYIETVAGFGYKFTLAEVIRKVS